MSKPPPPSNALPESVQSGLANNRAASHQMALLTNTGNQMAELGSQMIKFGQQGSNLQRHDMTQMLHPVLQLISQMVQVSSLCLEDTAQAASAVAATPSRRKASVQEQSIASKRTRFMMPNPTATPYYITPSSHTSLSRTGPTPAITPSASSDMEDTRTQLSFFPPAPDLNHDDMTMLYNVFSEESADSPYDMELTASGAFVEDLIPDNQGRKKKTRTPKKESAYLMKFVANTNPKMTLKAYFEQNDGHLICLCGRGAHNNHHPGNKAYRDFISSRVQDYQSLSKEGKENLTNSLVQEFENEGRRLFKLNDNNEWEELDQKSANKKIRKKISQRFRDD